jgi:hypothetical protein
LGLTRMNSSATGALANLGYRVCDQTVGNVLAAPRSAAGAGAQAHDRLVGVHSHPLGAAGGHRLLTAEVLCAGS